MKKSLFLVAIFALFTIFKVNTQIQAYSLKKAISDTITDTKDMYKQKPEFKIGIGYGLVSHTPQANGSIPVIAWKFIDIGPLIGFDTDGTRKTGKFGGLMTVRFGKIPLGDGTKIEDIVDTKPPEWLSRYWVGLGPMYDFTGGTGIDFLVNLGWKF